MTKSQMIAHIAIETGIDRTEVIKVVETFIHSIKHTLTEGESVHLRGFGSFIVKDRTAKKARNIVENTQIIIPAHKVPAFKPSKQFIDKIKEKTTISE